MRLVARLLGILVKFYQTFIYSFLLAPLLIVIVTSFDSRNYVSFPPQIGALSLHWYEFVVGYPTFVQGFKTSIVLELVTIPLAICIGVMGSFFFVRHEFRGKEFLSAALLSPLVVPGVVIGSSLVFLFASTGLIASFPNLVIAHVIITLPYVMSACTACLIGVDRSIEEAAMNLGANEFQTFLRVTLPSMKAGIVAGIIFVFAISFDDVATSAFLTDAYTYPFSIALVGYMRRSFDPAIAAASVLITLITIALVLAIEKTIGIERFIGFRA